MRARTGICSAAAVLLIAANVTSVEAASKTNASERKAAIAALEQKAEAGDVKAELTLGELYAGGQGVRRSYKDAARWWQMAADKGDPQALYALGKLHLESKGETSDPVAGMQMLRRSADAGYARAIAELGTYYETGGSGVVRDLKMAASLYQKAARLNDSGGEFLLGRFLMNGIVLAKDQQQAVKLYRAAAEQGLGPAMVALAEALERGYGTPRDEYEAYVWAVRASERKVKGASDEARRIEPLLTAEQVGEGQREAQIWQPEPATGAGAQLAAATANSSASSLKLVATGSGFYVSSGGDLVTNHHVIAGCTRIEVGTGASSTVEAHVEDDDAVNDLALLSGAPHPPAVAVLRAGNVRQAEMVVAYGFPLTGILSASGNATSGDIAALTGFDDDARFYQISAPIQPGNSGGPVLDQSGNVVGVVDAQLAATALAREGVLPQNVNFAIKQTVLEHFLDGSGVKYATAPISAAAKSAPDLSDAARAFTTLIGCFK